MLLSPSGDTPVRAEIHQPKLGYRSPVSIAGGGLVTIVAVCAIEWERRFRGHLRTMAMFRSDTDALQSSCKTDRMPSDPTEVKNEVQITS